MSYTNCPTCNGTGTVAEHELPMAVALSYAEEHLDKIDALQAEIAALREAGKPGEPSGILMALFEALDDVLPDHYTYRSDPLSAQLREHVGNLQAENAALRAALAFYADDASYIVNHDPYSDVHYTLVERDGGKRAAQALETEAQS